MSSCGGSGDASTTMPVMPAAITSAGCPANWDAPA
jgi:hypothetical protein